MVASPSKNLIESARSPHHPSMLDVLFARNRSLYRHMKNAAVTFNGISIPIRAVQSTLARYVDNLVVWNDNPEYRVSLVGSAILLHYQGRYFLICCNHQLKGQCLENVSILEKDGSVLFTSSGVRHFTDDCDPRYLDLAVFDFTDPCIAHPQLQERFFRLTDFPKDGPNTNTLFAIVAGFPSQKQGYHLDENHIEKVKWIVPCSLQPPTYDRTRLLRLQAYYPMQFSPDGMSGGSAFIVQHDGQRLNAYFAGMVVTAGNDSFHIIKVGIIRDFLALIVHEKNSV